MFKRVIELRKFDVGVRLISTNPAKRNTEAISISKRDDYYKNLGDTVDKNDTKPPGWDDALPYEAIPGPKPLPLIGNLWRFLPYVGEFHGLSMGEIYRSLKDKYGNVVILKGILGRKPMVVLFDVKDMETALRNEGPWPIRNTAESNVYYRTVVRKDVFQGVAGVVSVHGEDWFKFRSTVNPILMQPRNTQQYVGSMDIVANQLVDNIRYFSRQNEKNEMPEDFLNEIYKWSLESIGLVALDRHLGCLDLNAPKDSEGQKLISSVNEMFLLMYKLDVLPPIWKYIPTPSWNRYVKVLDYITEITMKYIDEAMNRSIEENTPDYQLSVIQQLAKKDKKIAVAMGMDMLVAGIDTQRKGKIDYLELKESHAKRKLSLDDDMNLKVSNGTSSKKTSKQQKSSSEGEDVGLQSFIFETGKTIGAALYFLAKNPDKQQALREEVLKNLPEKNSPVTKEVLNKSPYLKAVIKETTRIAPIGIGNLRTSVKDLVFGGYRVPKDTEVIMLNILSANSELFKDHHKFLPERWLRTTEDEYSHKNVNPFAYLPFGFGPRSCIGKRLANLELEVGLSKIVRNFELSWNREDMVFSGKLLYGIDSPLRLTVKELQK